jgi:UDP-N-acetylmuramoyl-tripeptide--D-alanyl-D-alanine ligase
MLPLTLGEAANACGASLENASPAARVTGVVIDSRSVVRGNLFVALPGTHADGHDFAGDAIARGAVAVLARLDRAMTGPVLRVADPAAALGSIAGLVRTRSRATVVAITGSSGKTCTKQFTAAALASRYRVAASAASYNNELGVPLTICSLEPDTEMLVAEVGSRGAGHIASLMRMLAPDISVVTNVGPAHFEMFGSLDATQAAKAELVAALGTDGIAVLNADDPRVLAMRERTAGRVVTFGIARDAGVRAENIVIDPHGQATFEAVAPSGHAKVALRVAGEHMVPNALAALAVAEATGVAIEHAAAAIEEVPGLPWRMEVTGSADGITVINDAYNANPASAAAALKTLATIGAGRRTWAVLGEMAELGPIAADEHDRLGRLAVRLGIKRLVAVGPVARPAAEAARLECMTPEEAVWMPDADEAIAYLRAEVAAGDVVLVKASRVAGLERVAAALMEDAG